MKAWIVLLCLVASGSAVAETTMEQDRAALNLLDKALSQVLKGDQSCERDSDCKVLAVGHRACGGPSRFAIVSRNNLNLSEIEYLAERTEVRQREFNQTYRVRSVCVPVSRPTVTCKEEVCSKR